MCRGDGAATGLMGKEYGCVKKLDGNLVAEQRPGVQEKFLFDPDTRHKVPREMNLCQHTGQKSTTWSSESAYDGIPRWHGYDSWYMQM